jgi:galactonate dehydratase
VKIADIQTRTVSVTKRGDWVFVIVHSDDGTKGIGEASHGRGDARVIRWIDELKPALVGWDVFQIEHFHQRFYHEYEGHTYHTAVSGIEQALWDLAGKALNVPIYRLLGGSCRGKLRVYANINRATWDRSPEGFAQNALKAVADGFTAIKCAPFDDLSIRNVSRGSLNPTIRTGIERVRRVREAVGPDIEMMIDCHSRFNAGLAVQVAKELEDVHLFWLEDLVPLTHLDALSQVRQSISTPIATGESLRTKSRFRELLAKQAVDYILPDVKYVGGILELKKIAALAEAAGVLVTPHNPSGPVATAASVQCMASVPNFAILEYAWGEVEWRSELVDPPEQIVDGFTNVSQLPGLGIDLMELSKSPTTSGQSHMKLL